MMTPEGSPLGKPTHYPERDDPALLFPIARSDRHDLLVAESALAHGLLACEGAIFPEINGPKNQLRSLTR
jgi:hypothetical protein